MCNKHKTQASASTFGSATMRGYRLGVDSSKMTKNKYFKVEAGMRNSAGGFVVLGPELNTLVVNNTYGVAQSVLPGLFCVIERG